MDQLLSQRDLVGRRLVIHVEDLISWPNMFLRMPVAVETPLHLQGRVLPNERHTIDLPMARAATNTLIHVNAVVKVGKVGKIMNPRPADGFVGAETIAHQLKHGTGGPDLGVTIHAGLRWRNPSHSSCFHSRVAVATVDANGCHVVLVTEGYRLFASHSSLRDITGAVNSHDDREHTCYDKNGAKDTELRKRVSAAVEDLRHGLLTFWISARSCLRAGEQRVNPQMLRKFSTVQKTGQVKGFTTRVEAPGKALRAAARELRQRGVSESVRN